MLRMILFTIFLLIVAVKINSQGISDSDYVLKIEFKKPLNQNIKEFLKIVPKKLYHSSSQGYFYIGVSEEELKSIFGLEIKTDIVKGAGNNIGADASFVEIKDIKKLNKKIKMYVMDLYIDDDPKFGVIDDAEEYILKPGK